VFASIARQRDRHPQRPAPHHRLGDGGFGQPRLCGRLGIGGFRLLAHRRAGGRPRHCHHDRFSRADRRRLRLGAPGERGITMAVHSTLGFGGAIVGPLIFGAIVDLFGRDGALGWGLAYGHVAFWCCSGRWCCGGSSPKPCPAT
jgi:hypothetical protein